MSQWWIEKSKTTLSKGKNDYEDQYGYFMRSLNRYLTIFIKKTKKIKKNFSFFLPPQGYPGVAPYLSPGVEIPKSGRTICFLSQENPPCKIWRQLHQPFGLGEVVVQVFGIAHSNKKKSVETCFEKKQHQTCQNQLCTVKWSLDCFELIQGYTSLHHSAF